MDPMAALQNMMGGAGGGGNQNMANFMQQFANMAGGGGAGQQPQMSFPSPVLGEVTVI